MREDRNLGLTVYRDTSESFESFLGRFNKKIERARIIKEWRDNQFFKKPSKIRKERMHRAKMKERKRRLEDY